jgi:hypothetical protein
MALQSFCWTLAAFSLYQSYTLSLGLLGRGIRSSQGRYLHTEQHKQNKRTNIHALTGIRTHKPSVRASDERPRGHSDRYLHGTTLCKLQLNLNKQTDSYSV